MGGTNPYLGQVETRLPAQKYKLTILPAGRVIEVDPARLPYSRDGRKGSILEIALGNDVEIDHACGGVAACSTCHVIVRQGFETMQEASDDELDQLDNARGLTPQSRLACQAVADGTRDVVVEIPSWNRNLASETAH